MGQGYSLTTLSAGSAGIDVPELSDLSYEKSLGNARFMKSIRARHKDGLVVAKVVMKPYQSLKLDKYILALQEERRILNDIPNALGYHRILETSTNGYLVRQYIHSSLYDRMSTRPFLEDIEKRWLSFQLLCAVRDCHARNIFHGDIKTENCLVTSWNWLYLSDFSSSFKPTFLPLDNPADFSFYFDTSGRRTCYLAPERFLEPGESPDFGVTWAMDIFSVGCVIAELFLEAPIFSLSQLFRYKNKEYDPSHTTLSKIEDNDIREMVMHMISRDPEQRYSAEEYLNFWRQKSFPEYFYSFLHQYMYLITDPSSGRAPLTSGKHNMGESDDRIDRVYFDFDKISYFLGYDNSEERSSALNWQRLPRRLFPLQVDIPNNRHQATTALSRTVDDGTLIFLQLVVSSLRSTARATARVHACELLLAFAERLTDEAKLDRVVPYLITLLRDPSEIVKVAAIRTLTQVLALVKVVSPINAHVFSEYILQHLQPFSPGHQAKPSSLVRMTYASCLASLATTASRYLDLVQGLRADGSLPTTDPETEDGALSHSMYQNLYDVARKDLVAQFEEVTKRLLQDPDAAVRRAFLGSVASLCVFFGSTKASDVVLSHLNTYLNDKDWMLKCAFFETIVGVATYVGGPSFEEFILPLMVQALTDPEEFVVERVLRSFSAIAELGLFQRSRTWELVDVVSRFTMHPNIWIREAAAQFISSGTKYLSIADRHSIILPLIKVYLRSVPTDLSELRILDSLKRPLPRLVLDMATFWAINAERGLFWKQVQQQRTFTFGADDTIPTLSRRDLGPRAMSRISKNEEDESWLTKLRNAGMTAEDEFKLLALREYIWRTAHRRGQQDPDSKPSMLSGVVHLKDLNITPQTVLFDNDQELFKENVEARRQRSETPRTIAEAMLDASTSVDEALVRRKGLLGRGEAGNKAAPEIGTSPANAIGSMDGVSNRDAGTRKRSNSPLALTPKEKETLPPSERYNPPHTYTGSDPTILKLLDSLYIENYPTEYIDFGPQIAPLNRRLPIKRVGSQQQPFDPWRPEGTLVAMLGEHTASVNRIAVAPDHTFFITGSDDGTVKVWDSSRFERNIVHRSRQTHRHGGDAKVTSLTFVENTHSFVSTASDGSVHVVKVHYEENQGDRGTLRYSRLKLVREYQLRPGQFAVWSEHFKADDGRSVLLLATNDSHILAIDLRTMSIVYDLQNPLNHGTPTTFCVDRKHHWLLLGTSHGVLDLWDLRFHLRLRAWGFPGGAPIHRISSVPVRHGAKKGRICIAGGTGQGEITVWDLEKAVCKEVYRTGAAPPGKENVKAYRLVDIDEEKAGGMLGRFATAIDPAPGGSGAGTDRGVRALVAGAHVPEHGGDPRYFFLLSAGPDWKVRYWDTAHYEASCIVSGMELDEGKPTYTETKRPPELTIVQEELNQVGGGGVATSSRSGQSDGQTTPKKAGKGQGRSALVSLQTQNLLKSHLDMVMDVALLEVPYGMVISVDRAGMIYVFA
ncbi:phosphoinositide 3-kinase regulatory subunit 4 [Rhizodiscina lignyota]|uniref:non-specific serine/threonine protein kinase n=1 Tax=Rhizodiscina lignyota TaxID=1504668 RepID=A0A9P4MA58_9PEZI|nr:phosphoinositide 3-kinase regulatory subunit 4 [Rhizodiscina lignyota]